jgi:hypothetical protein
MTDERADDTSRDAVPLQDEVSLRSRLLDVRTIASLIFGILDRKSVV